MTDHELIHHFSHGISEARYASVIAQSERYIIFRIKGHTDWAGVGMRSYYPTEHVLIRKGEWWLTTSAAKQVWEGRVSRKVLMKALAKAEAQGKL